MVVDDSQVICRQIEAVLSKQDFDVVSTAADGVLALRDFRMLKPDLVTMDLTMPRLDGIQTIKQMMIIHPGVRILVVSAVKDKATALRALRLGAYGFLCKPFTRFELAEAVDVLISDLGKT